MKFRRSLAVFLAAVLQLLPLWRVFPAAPAAAAAPAWAVVLRLAAGAVAFLGSHHAVSGATSINTPYTLTPSTGTAYTHILSTAVRTAQSWSAPTAASGSAIFPLTPGLWLTNNGRIGGIPTWSGTSNITIFAWEFSGNSGPSVSAVFTFSVSAAGPPGIRTQPVGLSLGAGSNATFSVAAYGATNLAYQWLLAGAPITGASSSAYTRTNVGAADAGGYSVVVTNSLGTITSAVATLTVRTPPVITNQPANVTVVAGNPATFSVGAGGTAPLGYQWRFNGTNLAGATLSSYTLPAAQTFNAGAYSVQVTNSLGTNVSAGATLTVTVPAVVLKAAPGAAGWAAAFNALPGTNYVVQSSPDLRVWTTLTNVVAPGTNVAFTDTLTNRARYYRVNRPTN